MKSTTNIIKPAFRCYLDPENPDGWYDAFGQKVRHVPNGFVNPAFEEFVAPIVPRTREHDVIFLMQDAKVSKFMATLYLESFGWDYEKALKQLEESTK